MSEEELHGFVDGVLDLGRSKAVEAFLAASPADAWRVQSWRRQNERFARPSRRWKRRARLAFAQNLARPWERGGRSSARSRSWRERWFLPLIGLAFASGGPLMAGVDYFAGRPAALDSMRSLPRAARGDGGRGFRRAGHGGAQGFRAAGRRRGGPCGRGRGPRARRGGAGLAQSSRRGPQADRRSCGTGRAGQNVVHVLHKTGCRRSRALRRKNAWPKREDLARFSGTFPCI